jgi:hypothetical protein
MASSSSSAMLSTHSFMPRMRGRANAAVVNLRIRV